MDISHRIATLSPEKRELLIRSLKARKVSPSPQAITARRRDSDHAPCSFAQQRLWFLHQLEPASCAYNMAGALRIKGPLNVEVLQQTLDEISRRHESLRTTFREVDGQPVQVISPNGRLPMRRIDLRHLPQAEREKEAVRLAYEEAHTPFDLAKGPIIRVVLIDLAPDEYAWLLTMHHINSDGWSNGVLIGEIVSIYQAFLAGDPSPLPELAIQYADYAVWQREYLQGSVLEEHLGYWKQQLGADLPTLNLATDFPRPTVLGDRGDARMHAFDRELTDAIKRLCQKERVTLFVALMASIQSVFHAATGQDDIVIGTDVANRNRVETENLIGFCINQLVLRTNLAGNPTLRELMARVWKVSLNAYAHQDMPFDFLVKELNPRRSNNRTPLFQVKFVLQNTPEPELDLPGLIVEPLLVDNHTSKFDIIFNVHEYEEALQLGTMFNTDLFKPSTIDRLLRQIDFTLRVLVAEPDLPLSRYVDRLNDYEAKYQLARQEEFKKSSRQRLQFNRQKDLRREHTHESQIVAGRQA